MNRILKGAVCLAAAGLALTGCAEMQLQDTYGPKLVEAKEGPYRYQVKTLQNGMRIVTLEDHSTPLAAVQVWYHVGSKNETPDRHGFAHMFEHMMFRGTDRLGPESHFNFIRGTGGDTNAYTAFDQTVYVQEVPSNQVEMVLWLEAERMAFLKVDEEGFKTERNVVAEEFRMGAEAPYGTVADKLMPEVFRGGTYSWTPIGNLDNLYAANVGELQTFWETYYTPNNATLVVVGDIDHKQVQEMAERYFGWIPRYPAPPPLAVPPSEPNAEPMKIQIKEKNGPAPIVALGYRTVPSGHPDELPLDMLTSILGGGESSRLYSRMVTQDESAMVAVAGAFSLEKDGILGAGAVLSPFGSDKEKALATLREEIERLKAEGPTERELEKAKNNALRSAVTGQLTAASKAQSLGSAQVLLGDIGKVNRQFDDIRAVTAEDLKRVANEYIRPEREMEIRIEPSLLGFLMNQVAKGSKDEKAREDVTDINAAIADLGRPSGKPGLDKIRPDWMPLSPPVAPLLDADVNIPSYEMKLANGLTVVAIPNHEVPFVSFTLGNLYGAWTDPTAAPGTATMAHAMLTRGTDTHTYEQLAEELDYYAISVSGSSNNNVSAVSASAVTDQAERAMGYLAEVVRTPTFPEDQLKKLVKQARTGKAIEEKSPEFLAERELNHRLFGDHPYGRSADGQMKDLDNLDAGLMRDWWHTYVRPDTSALYVAGDLSKEEAFAMAEKAFGDWKAQGPAPVVELAAMPEAKTTQIYLVNRKGEQAQIRVGHAFPEFTRHHARYFNTRLLNQYFGGGFNSRLNKTIRVEKGLTYGAFGGVSADRFGGKLIISTFSKNATTAEAVSAIIDEVRRLKNEQPSEEELESARSYLIGNFVLNRETPQSIVQDQWLLRNENLPGNYYQQYLDGIRNTSREDVMDSIGELISEDALTIVVVGPADELKEGLEKIAPVTVVEPSKS